jgi:hypothetical protein
VTRDVEAVAAEVLTAAITEAVALGRRTGSVVHVGGMAHTYARRLTAALAAETPARCPVCRHAPHDALGFCPNFASDNDCDCAGVAPAAPTDGLTDAGSTVRLSDSQYDLVSSGHIRAHGCGGTRCSAREDDLRVVASIAIAHRAAAEAAARADERERALLAAADEMEAVIADGDVAEVAAPVAGEVGRSAVVARRNDLYEEPSEWLRQYARAALAQPAETGSDCG